MSTSRGIIDVKKIEAMMREVGIPGISIALIDSKGNITPIPLGYVRYDIELKPDDKSAYKPNVMYIHTSEKGLAYEILDENKELIKTEIPWNKLRSFPHDAAKIIKSKDTTQPVLQAIAQDAGHIKPVTTETVFNAASLSKPLFAYLVLKLIEEAKSDSELFDLKKNDGRAFNLDTPLYHILPELSRCPEKDKAEALTPRIVLSHLTGIPHSHQGGVPRFDSAPGTEYEYNGVPYFYLQIALERLTNASLEELAKKYLFKDLMPHSTFQRDNYIKSDPNADLFQMDLSKYPAMSANSLRTTASDYARLIRVWMNDEKLQYAFKKTFDMTIDPWANGINVSPDVLKKVGWGIGMGLQTNNEDRVIRAFHSGDMNEWRAFVAVNLDDKNNKRAAVFFANSPNGLVLANEIVRNVADVSDGSRYISEKYGFAMNPEPQWKKKENDRFEKIGDYLKSKKHSSVAVISKILQIEPSSPIALIDKQQVEDDKKEVAQSSTHLSGDAPSIEEKTAEQAKKSRTPRLVPPGSEH